MPKLKLPKLKLRTKITGSITELSFAIECMKRGAMVSQPLGDTAAYDLLVDVGRNIYKVQVKTAGGENGRFQINAHRRVPTPRLEGVGTVTKAVPYNVGDIDFIVTLVEGGWYIFDEPHLLPATVPIYSDPDRAYVKRRPNLRYANGYACCRNRWDLLGLS